MVQERQAKIIYMISGDLMILSLSEVLKLQIDTLPEEIASVNQIALSLDNSKIAILSNTGLLWIGLLDEDRTIRIVQINQPDLSKSEIAWCGIDAVIGFDSESFQYWILGADGSNSGPQFQKEFFSGFVSVVPEIDSVRVYSLGCQELFRYYNTDIA